MWKAVDNCTEGRMRNLTISPCPAQKFLSCVKRTGERFGAAHVTNVLLGIENEKVLKYNHQELSTFGIGKELTRKQWLHIAQQLVQKGQLEQSNDIFHVLSLTPRAWWCSRAASRSWGILPQAETASTVRQKQGEVEYNHDLFAILRAKRKDLAEAANVPPYVIFSDRTLVEIAARFQNDRRKPQAHQWHRPGQIRTLRSVIDRSGPGVL